MDKTSELAAIKNFEEIYLSEIDRLEKEENNWQKHLEESSGDKALSEAAQSDIRLVLGQIKLLKDKKLNFFGDLLKQATEQRNNENSPADNENKAPLIFADDLDGYWSIIQLEIEKIHGRVKRLHLWKEKNYNDDLRPNTPHRKTNIQGKSIVINKAEKKPVTSRFKEFRANIKKPNLGESSNQSTENNE